MNIFRTQKKLSTLTTLLVLVIYPFVFYTPFALAAKQGIEEKNRYELRLEKKLKREGFSGNLQKLKTTLIDASVAVEKEREGRNFFTNLYANLTGASAGDEFRQTINELALEIEALDQAEVERFAAMTAHFEKHDLPVEIRHRHKAMVKAYKSKIGSLKRDLNVLKKQKGKQWEQSLEGVVQFMEQQQFQK